MADYSKIQGCINAKVARLDEDSDKTKLRAYADELTENQKRLARHQRCLQSSMREQTKTATPSFALLMAQVIAVSLGKDDVIKFKDADKTNQNPHKITSLRITF